MATLPSELSSMKADLAAKHAQNRNDIHNFREALQEITDKFFLKLDALTEKVTELRVNNARWSLGAGILTAVAIKTIDHFVK